METGDKVHVNGRRHSHWAVWDEKDNPFPIPCNQNKVYGCSVTMIKSMPVTSQMLV